MTEILSEIALSGNTTDYLRGDGIWSAFPTIPVVSDTAYGAAWNGNTEVPTKNAVYDKIETITSNATHTGDVTGATALTLQSVAISGKSAAAPAGNDSLLISDVSDSGNLKKVTVQAVIDLAIPSQTGNSGKFLTTNGTATSWATITSYTLAIGNSIASGTNNRLLYQSGGNLAQSANLTFDGNNLGVVGSAKVSDTLRVGDMTTAYGGYNLVVIGGTSAGAAMDFVHGGSRIAEFFTTTADFNFFTDTGKKLNFYVNNNTGTAALSFATNRDATFGGDVEIADASKGVVRTSPNGTRWRETINNSGALVTTAI